MASLADDVYFCAIKYSAAAIKSSNTFCFLSLVPASCHFSPYSPPPRMFADAYTTPCSSMAMRSALNPGLVGRCWFLTPAVTIKHRRIVSVQLDAPLVRDEHGHARAVFTAIEDLPG